MLPLDPSTKLYITKASNALQTSTLDFKPTQYKSTLDPSTNPP